jgi:hypothetical protein
MRVGSISKNLLNVSHDIKDVQGIATPNNQTAPSILKTGRIPCFRATTTHGVRSGGFRKRQSEASQHNIAASGAHSAAPHMLNSIGAESAVVYGGSAVVTGAQVRYNQQPSNSTETNAHN